MPEFALNAPERPIFGRTVLQIVPSLQSGGAERTTLEIAEALTAAGARAIVASEGGRWVSDLQARGGEFLEFAAAVKNPVSMALNACRLARIIRNERIDLVHVRSRAPAWTAYIATRKTKTPFVTTYHSAYSAGSDLKRRYNEIMAKGDAVIANSSFTAAHIHDTYPQACERIATIPRGVDLRAFAPELVKPERVRALRHAWGAGPEHRIVLLPARLARRKGHLFLIEAAKILTRRGRENFLFVFAGDGGSANYRAEIERAAANAGLSDRVRSVGFCDDMAAAYIAAACVTMPSLEPEAFGRVAIEAQAMGAAVVATDHGGARETILCPPQTLSNLRTGWRTPLGDQAAMALAIEEAVAMGAAARDGLSVRARGHVRAKFSIDRMCQRTLNLYEALIAAPPQKRA